MQPKAQFHIIYVILAILGVMLIHEFWSASVAPEQVPYSRFEQMLNDKQISEVVIEGNQIYGKLNEPLKDGKTQVVANLVDPELAKKLDAAGVTYSQREQSKLLPTLLSWFLPVIVFFGLWVLLMRYMASKGGLGGQFMSIGKSKAKIYVEKDTKTTFEDVAGVDEAKAELQEVVSFLKDPKSYGRLGARMPKGVVLVGPPGTGKTLIARAVAGEAQVPFFSISGSDFVEMFVGVGAARVRDLFEQARQRAPAIIFIDELDAIGRARGIGPSMGGYDEKEQTLNQLLVELDGFDASAGVVILAATNRPEILDPALLRAGRFDRQVLVDRPDKVGRVAILRVHAKKVQIAVGVALDQVAALTPGFSGADLENLVNEAALVATRRHAEEVTLQDFTVAVERIVAGLERKNRLLNPDERRIVAFHEMGHALVSAALPGTDTVHKISIIPRGIGALGYTIQRPTEDRYLMRREELENKMAVLLGGRAAERILFDHLSTGAADDIAKCTEIARNMVVRFGMDEKLGNVAYETEPQSFLGGYQPPQPRRYSEQTAREIDEAVQALVDGALRRAEAILRTNRALLDEGGEMLIEKETLDEPDLKSLFDRVRRPKESAA